MEEKEKIDCGKEKDILTHKRKNMCKHKKHSITCAHGVIKKSDLNLK